MAEAVLGSLVLKIASSFMAGVGSSLYAHTEEELSLLVSLRSDMEDILKELEMIQIVIRNADKLSESDGVAAAWVKEVREAAYEIEDIIDEFTYFVGRPKKTGLRNSLGKPWRLLKNLPTRHDIARRLKNIRGKIIGISERRTRYKELGEGMPGGSKNGHVDLAPFFKNDADIVGMEDQKEKLISWLTDENTQRMEISVSGMGGAGKTTLVFKVYKSEKIEKDFQWRAFVTVSKTYDRDDILRKIYKELHFEKSLKLPLNIDELDTRWLAETLYKFLENKRYLIFLDDVWDEDLWSKIKDVFPGNSSKRRIIFTTRNNQIASSFASSNRVLNIQPLEYNKAWELFCKTAFQGDRGGICPQELSKTAKAIVRKCDGLPLAILTLGGLLYSKHDEIEWSNTLNTLRWMLTNKKLEKISNILMLSFYDLPDYMKNCFLYCSAFPEDFHIKRKRIIRLWAAEEFVEQKGGMTVEEVAEECLMGLVQRNMLQVSDTNGWGRLQTIRMHDVVRDLAISISEKQNFCMMLGSGQTDRARRLSITGVRGNNEMGLDKMCYLRSLLVFASIDLVSHTFNRKETLGFRLLRVLNLEGASIDNITDAVGDLFNLRFLSLRKTKVKMLPKSFGKLQNLQTLDISFSGVEELPSWVSELRNLRHLFIVHAEEFYLRVPMKTSPGGIWTSKDMQVLSGIISNSEVVRQVGEMTQLRTFVILEVEESDEIELCASIKRMTFLNRLVVQAVDRGRGQLKLENLDPQSLRLQKLSLRGRFQRLPQWLSSLANLKMLWLHSCRLLENPLTYLKSLPKLETLELLEAYDGEELCFQANDFFSLKELYFCQLDQLHQVTIEEGAMRSLKKICLTLCGKLKTLPQGIERLNTLKVFYMYGMPEELVESIRVKGVDRQKISHIPTVHSAPQKEDGGWGSEWLS
ncbi:Disease resistance protein RPM1 [Acorus gramineus]|uniref:Disease resistance protein RPM1 n=1 Tax=Acorus gramineus TaxID=55184 RepID=A0AAV9BCH2_ACOGR|nr:Disease resistance protein RPM1 [Acorus gramineus]